MSRLRIAPTRDSFTKDEQPFFYFADTVWDAFFAAQPDEWQEYLVYRSRQGFNTLQISLLPILHDSSASRSDIFPFHRTPDGTIDFYRLNEDYFAHVAALIEQATQAGFTCALVLLWCNYAPDTWISLQAPEFVIPFDAVQPYVEYVVNLLDRYQPVYLISGDTDFRSQKTNETYLKALTTVKCLSPESLTCLHISPYTDLPKEIIEAQELDFYMYQSGHRLEEQAFLYTLAEKFAQIEPRRPVINGEPCYESAGHGFKYGRFAAFDMRKALWSSVLSGASAGFTYGAHGVWSWHRRGAAFLNEDWSKTPFDWRVALQLPGAWDVGFGVWLLQRYGLSRLEPRNDLRKTPYEEIRVAMLADGETIVIYAPYAVAVEIQLDLREYTFDGFDLSTRQIFKPGVTLSANGTSLLEMPTFNADALFIGTRSSQLKK